MWSMREGICLSLILTHFFKICTIKIKQTQIVCFHVYVTNRRNYKMKVFEILVIELLTFCAS